MKEIRVQIGSENDTINFENQKKKKKCVEQLTLYFHQSTKNPIKSCKFQLKVPRGPLYTYDNEHIKIYK